jgi:hypothetical protein
MIINNNVSKLLVINSVILKLIVKQKLMKQLIFISLFLMIG